MYLTHKPEKVLSIPKLDTSVSGEHEKTIMFLVSLETKYLMVSTQNYWNFGEPKKSSV